MNPLNPYAILASIVVALCLFGSGVATGVRWQTGQQAINSQHITQAVDAANKSSAEAIATLKPVYTTIQAKLEKQIETKTVYRDCRLDADSLQLINYSLSGAHGAGSGKLPGADAAGK